MNPLQALFKSRKFLVLALDTVISLVLLIGGWFLAPDALDKVAAVIAILQAPATMIIYAIAAEDNAERKLQAAVYESDKWTAVEKQQESEGAG